MYIILSQIFGKKDVNSFEIGIGETGKPKGTITDAMFTTNDTENEEVPLEENSGIDLSHQ